MDEFTVVLLRPDYLADDDAGGFGQDVYVAQVLAETAELAVGVAQAEVFQADVGLGPSDADDYALVAVFSGHHRPVLWGWSV